MNPVLFTIVPTLAHREAGSALPWSPVVTEPTPRAAGLRVRTGSALHALARRIEPYDARQEQARYRTA